MNPYCKKIEWFKYYWPLLLLFLQLPLSAQLIPFTAISGRIIDADTDNPIYYAQIFMAATTYGCTSDTNGYFRLDNIPAGNYQIVISMIGYALLTRTVHLDGGKIELNFSLHPKVIQGEEVRVTASHPVEWNKQLKKFRELFIGTSNNSNKCTILNPEVLNFKYDTNTGEFKAESDLPLKIVNLALGYTIEYYLEDFLFTESFQQNENIESHRASRQYRGKYNFRNVKSRNSKESERWQKNRIRTYKGSTLHFFRALYQNQLKEEGFQMWVQSGAGAEKIDESKIVYHSDLPYEKILMSPRFIMVKYKNRSSGFALLTDSIRIYESGHLDEPNLIRFYGDWTNEGIADLLPIHFLIEPAEDPMPIRPVSEKYAMDNPADQIKQAKELAITGKDFRKATHLLYTGLERLGNHAYADILFQELSSIMSDHDKKAFYKTDDKGRFLLKFWWKQDVTPATEVNERFIELTRFNKIMRDNVLPDSSNVVYRDGAIWIFDRTSDIPQNIDDIESFASAKNPPEIGKPVSGIGIAEYRADASINLPCALYMARFYQSDKAKLEIYYGLPWKSMESEVNENGARYTDLNISYSIVDSAFSSQKWQESEQKPTLDPDIDVSKAVFINQINEFLNPGTYRISLLFKNPMSGKRSEKEFTVKIPEFAQNALLVSDIEIASNIMLKDESHIDTIFTKNDLVIIPYPFYHISIHQPVYFYFEISNLMFDDTGYTSYEVEYRVRSANTSLFQRLNPFRHRISLSSSFNRKGVERNVQEYFSIDFKNLPPREYTLTIQVTDELSSEKIETDVRFKLK